MEYKKYDDEVTKNIFSSLSLMHEAAWYLLDNYTQTDIFKDLTGNILTLITSSEIPIMNQLGKEHSLFKILENIRATVSRLISGKYAERIEMKIQFELIPLIEEAYLYARYFLWAVTSDERMEEYKSDVPSLCANYYIDEAEETGNYKYDVAFIVTGYNKLDYTKMCVENLLKNIPKDLNYELILFNHGSSDGTYEYFQSVCPTKQLDLAINGGGYACVSRAIESKYCISISNDVIIGKNAIDNMLACIKSDERIAYVVPSTSSVSNLQSISANYNSLDEFYQFVEVNNVSDQFRWEQRTRLVNPISLARTSVIYGKDGILINGQLSGATHTAFPDDRLSLFLRRNKYKLMLAKDAYCHHFGSITIKDEMSKSQNVNRYDEGRLIFKEAFGIDPWGVGFCYDPAFLNRIVDDENGHVDILGINCGMGSNSLKIKEQIKEFCHNTDTCLLNITDDKKYIADLEGISDEAVLVSDIKGLRLLLQGRTFKYIVWDAPFIRRGNLNDVFNVCLNCLEHSGKMLINLQYNKLNLTNNPNYSVQPFGKGWSIISKNGNV